MKFPSRFTQPNSLTWLVWSYAVNKICTIWKHNGPLLIPFWGISFGWFWGWCLTHVFFPGKSRLWGRECWAAVIGKISSLTAEKHQNGCTTAIDLNSAFLCWILTFCHRWWTLHPLISRYFCLYLHKNSSLHTAVFMCFHSWQWFTTRCHNAIISNHKWAAELYKPKSP